MVISLPFDVSFTLTRHELAKALVVYTVIHLTVWLYMNINKVIKGLVVLERRKLENKARKAIIRRHIFDNHTTPLRYCDTDDCAMLSSPDLS